MSSLNKDHGVDLDAQLKAAAGPTHRPFSRLDPGATSCGAVFIESVADMCAGLQTCLQLVHSTDLALQARSMDDDEPAPLLGAVDRERLLRLAIAVTGTLVNGAHQEIEQINAQAPKGAARKEAGK
jgi:hypothetical protein